MCNTIRANIVIQLFCKFEESNSNPDWCIALMNSFDNNDILNDYKNLGQYDQNARPSQIMTCYNSPASLVNQNEIPVDLSCLRTHMALIMSLTSIWGFWPIWLICNTIQDIKATLQVWWIKTKSYWVTVLTSSSCINYVLNEHVDVDHYGPCTIPFEIMPC